MRPAALGRRAPDKDCPATSTKNTATFRSARGQKLNKGLMSAQRARSAFATDSVQSTLAYHIKGPVNRAIVAIENKAARKALRNSQSRSSIRMPAKTGAENNVVTTSGARLRWRFPQFASALACSAFHIEPVDHVESPTMQGHRVLMPRVDHARGAVVKTRVYALLGHFAGCSARVGVVVKQAQTHGATVSLQHTAGVGHPMRKQPHYYPSVAPAKHKWWALECRTSRGPEGPTPERTNALEHDKYDEHNAEEEVQSTGARRANITESPRNMQVLVFAIRDRSDGGVSTPQ
ncbi:hypothetical protein OPT61_g5227 [Boeremia exigua]|uniref:Uncharacterized protein n=1 Tax=Boeremia exigua TaxID=749465 RepID=A0ACC2IB16_9PLEO|nr:hypothetical protein OPT61_g5227 [Boeremia exigua]